MNFFSNSSLWQSTAEFMFIPSKQQFNLSGKIFAFDLDGTLTTSKNGMDPKKYNEISSDNWLFLGPVKEKLKEISKDYSIFIITNQQKISHMKQEMIMSVYNELDCVPTILCANQYNQFRKPNTGFIQVIRSMLLSNNIDFNQHESFYSGDAVGPSDAFLPYRWGEDDLNFAVNSGLTFVRPNDIFGHSVVMPTENLVIMMGTPGSLKTTFAKGLENYGYIRMSQDEVKYKDLQKSVNEIASFLLSGQKVVLDATFAKEEKRAFWLSLVQNLNQQYNIEIKVHILWNIREGRPWNDKRGVEERVSSAAYYGPNGYVKNFSDPRNSQSIYHHKVTQLY